MARSPVQRQCHIYPATAVRMFQKEPPRESHKKAPDLRCRPMQASPERNNCSTYESVNEILVRNNFKLSNRGKTRDTVIYYNANLINHNN